MDHICNKGKRIEKSRTSVDPYYLGNSKVECHSIDRFLGSERG